VERPLLAELPPRHARPASLRAARGLLRGQSRPVILRQPLRRPAKRLLPARLPARPLLKRQVRLRLRRQAKLQARRRAIRRLLLTRQAIRRLLLTLRRTLALRPRRPSAADLAADQ
jgi:hypothetical protein